MREGAAQDLLALDMPAAAARLDAAAALGEAAFFLDDGVCHGSTIPRCQRRSAGCVLDAPDAGKRAQGGNHAVAPLGAQPQQRRDARRTLGRRKGLDRGFDLRRGQSAVSVLTTCAQRIILWERQRPLAERLFRSPTPESTM